MRLVIQATLPEEWFLPLEPMTPRWMGAFTQLEVLIALRACSKDGRCLFFEVESEGRLLRVEEESPLVAACTFQRVRVVAVASRRWLFDSDPSSISDEWRLWAYGARPMARL